MTHTVLYLAFGLLIAAFMLPDRIVAAGESSTVQKYLLRYDTLKTRTSALVSSVDHGGEKLAMADRRPLLQLRQEVMDFCFETRREGHVEKLATSGDHSRPLNLLTLAYACEAMEQVLEAEWDASQHGSHMSGTLQAIQEKYKEVWKLADHLVNAGR